MPFLHTDLSLSICLCMFWILSLISWRKRRVPSTTIFFLKALCMRLISTIRPRWKRAPWRRLHPTCSIKHRHRYVLWVVWQKSTCQYCHIKLLIMVCIMKYKYDGIVNLETMFSCIIWYIYFSLFFSPSFWKLRVKPKKICLFITWLKVWHCNCFTWVLTINTQSLMWFFSFPCCRSSS